MFRKCIPSSDSKQIHYMNRKRCKSAKMTLTSAVSDVLKIAKTTLALLDVIGAKMLLGQENTKI